MKCLFLLISIFFLPFSIFYVPSCYAAQWIQKGETAFAEGETADTEICGVGASASIRLNTSDFEEWGNDFIIDTQTEYALDNSNKLYSCRFTAEINKTVSKVWFCITLSNPPWPTYIIGLQDNVPSAPCPNHPSGVWLSSNTYTPSIVDGHGWQEVSLTPQYTLTAGTTYHLVIKYSSGTINSDECMSIHGTNPQNNKVPYDNTLDLMSAQLCSTDGGTNWSDNYAQPLFVIESNAGEYEGNPYYKIDEDFKIFGDALWRGEKFIISGGNKTVKKFFFYLRANTASPSNDLYVVLEDITAGSVMEVKAIDKSKIATYYKEYEHTFDTPHILENGKEYRLYLKSPFSVAENCYMIKRLCINYKDPDMTNQALISTTYGGADAVYTFYNGTWSDQTSPESYADIIFKFESATYDSSGKYISKAFDTDSSSEFKEISWEPVTQPSQTSLKFQIAASDNSGGPWLFLGPDGTESSYYTEAIGEAISSRHTGKRYIKYKAFFDTSDLSYSPHLDKVTIEYAARPLSGRSLEAYNTPNPFEAGRELTTISYILEKDCRVYIRIYTLLGDLVKEMKFSPGEEGGRGESDGYENNVSWDGKNGRGMLVADGVYLSQIIAEPRDGSKIIKEIRKIAVIK